MSVDIKTFEIGPFGTNTYLLCCDGDTWVIDPGIGPDSELVDYLKAEGITPSRILLTHGHADHIGGIKEIMDNFDGVKLCCPAAEKNMLTDSHANLSAPFGMPVETSEADELLEPGQELMLGESRWLVLDTSGHTPGGISFYCRDEKVVITGDSLFAGSIGRTDFPGSDSVRLLETIKSNLLTLPEETRVLPGHGPESTIGKEKLANPFLQRL